MTIVDDMGTPITIARPVRRVVSLVPSLTESVACTHPEALVGATEWCTHPVGLDVPRVRGTKNPDLRAIRTLKPDLVLANKEENRELDVRRLRDAGVPVWVTVIESVPQALTSLHRLFTEALGWPVPPWLHQTTRLWSGPPKLAEVRAAIAVWRDPWMVVGSSTFTGDLVRRLGLHNVFSDHLDRYPKVALDDIDRSDVDVVLLPDEPYAFGPDDGPEAFLLTKTALVSGRQLTWYGPSLLEAPHALRRAI